MFQIPERKKKYVILAHGSIQLKISTLQAVHLQLDSRFGSVSVPDSTLAITSSM